MFVCFPSFYTYQLLNLHSGHWTQFFFIETKDTTTTLSIKLTGADLICNNRPAVVPEISSNHQASCLVYAGCVAKNRSPTGEKKLMKRKEGKETERGTQREWFPSGVFLPVIRLMGTTASCADNSNGGTCVQGSQGRSEVGEEDNP